MSTTIEPAALDVAIAEAELDEEHAQQLRELVEEGRELDDALAEVVADQEGSSHEPTQAEQEAAIAGPTPEQVEKLEKEHDRHHKALERIMGPAFSMFHECEACEGQGITVGEPAPQLQTNDRYKVCGSCSGYGVVLTGAINESNRVVSCPGCAGRGFLERLTPPQAAPTPNVEMTQTPEEYGTPAWMGDPDIRPTADGWTPSTAS